MNKQDLIKAITESRDLHGLDVKAVVDEFFAQIEAALARGEKVRISGFGTFRRMTTKARTGRNLRTGEAIEIPARNRAKFKASSKLKV